MANWVWQRPWSVLVIAAAVVAIAFPRVGAGSTGLVILTAGAGIAALVAVQRLGDRTISPRLAGWIAIATVSVAGLVLFIPVLGASIEWPQGDWGPQHAVLRGVVDKVASFELPHWNHRISTGDAPLDVYPALSYIVVAALALVSGMEDDLPRLLVYVGIALHVVQAINATRLARRFLPAPIAALIGLVLLVDRGNVSSGGVFGTVQWGLLHTAVAQTLLSFAIVAIVDAVRRPRLRTSIAIWVFTALTVATHPAGLLGAAVVMIALVAVALLARDVPTRRPLIAICHVVLGVALGAAIWMPMGDRIVRYGQHFSNVLRHPAEWLTGLLATPLPQGSFAAVVAVGYAGVLAALWSRRATAILVAASALVALVAVSDAPYLAFDLAPSQAVARLGADRFYGLARPFLFVAAGYVVMILFGHVRERWVGASRGSRLVGAAIAGVLGLAGLRFAGQAAERLSEDTRAAAKASFDMTPLDAWAREALATAGPDRWGRAWMIDVPYYLHVTANTGLPAFHLGPTPAVLLRERIADGSPESLRRFDVRWVIAPAGTPIPGLPAVASERSVGDLVVRELAGWDGKLARVERGEGQAVVTRLDDDAVDVELRATAGPALVALGMGYYPRWRARDEAGRDIPVYAYPATPGSQVHVLAAWLSPGRTRFTPDGALPSDGRGLPLAIGALVIALAIISVWSVRRARWWVLRRAARTRQWLGRRAPHLSRIAIAIGVLGLVAWGAFASTAPVRSLELGTGLRATAKVSVRRSASEPWRRCDYARALGEYRCDGLAVVTDTTAAILNDEQPLWPFTTPAIQARSLTGRPFELRIRLDRRLAGRYWVGSTSPAVVSLGDEPAVTTDRQRVLDVADGDRAITIDATVPGTGFSITAVEERTLIPARDEPAPPVTAGSR